MSMRKIFLVPIISALFTSCNAYLASANAEDFTSRSGVIAWEDAKFSVHAGEDWRMPRGTPQCSPHGGFYNIWGQTTNLNLAVVDIIAPARIASWREFNPREGKYAFARIEITENNNWYHLGLDKARELGQRSLFWMQVADGGAAVPQWVMDKYNVPLVHGYAGCSGSRLGDLKLHAVWEAGPRRELEKTIKAIGKRYKHDPLLEYVYVCSFFYGGEFFLSGGFIRRLEEMGYTAQTLEDYCLWLIDTWAEAMGPQKCVWEGLGDFQNGCDNQAMGRYLDMSRRVVNYALEKGLQFRTGYNEMLFNTIPVSLIGDTWDDKGYIRHHGLPVKFLGDEIEGQRLLLDDYIRFKMMTLQCLKAGYNYLMYDNNIYNIPKAGHAYNPTYPSVLKDETRMAVMRDYARSVVGYSPGDAPDAWCALRKMYSIERKLYRKDDPYKRPYMEKPRGSPVKNFERFLYQRDVEAGMTRPAMKRTWIYTEADVKKAKTLGWEGAVKAGSRKLALGWASSQDYTYEARQTDWASGNPGIYFKIDETFFSAPGPQKVVIMVTYLDQGSAEWEVQYDDGTQPYASAGKINCRDTEKIMTAVFPIELMLFRESQTANMDFRIKARGDDVIIQFVRVLKMETASSGYSDPSGSSSLPIKVFPNPATGSQAFIQFSVTNVSRVKITIHNISGKLVS